MAAQRPAYRRGEAVAAQRGLEFCRLEQGYGLTDGELKGIKPHFTDLIDQWQVVAGERSSPNECVGTEFHSPSLSNPLDRGRFAGRKHHRYRGKSSRRESDIVSCSVK